MVERKTVNGSLALANKQVRVITIEATEKPRAAKLRVAAYARVSSFSADQLNSFAAQNDYYQNLIRSKENWSLADIYADEGISGTSTEKRPDFQRLIADCHRGLIDRIVVKSISRNTRWGNRKRMAAGTFLPSSMPYGYRLIDKEIVIEPDEALVVRRIYQDYLAGMGMDVTQRAGHPTFTWEEMGTQRCCIHSQK